MKTLAFSLSLLALVSLAAHASEPSNANEWATKIDPRVLQFAAESATGETDFLVFLKEQADVSAAAKLKTKLEKGTYVFQKLTEVAQRTQSAMLRSFDEQGIKHQSFWVANMVLVHGNSNVIQQMAQRSEVGHVFANPKVHFQTPFSELEPQPNPPLAIEPGVNFIHAPSVWALGYTGQGVVVAGNDTGYRWTHNALKNHYRGWDGTAADHNYNWHDSIHSGGGVCGPDSAVPCDDDGHGTHTMGTMVGSDGGTNQVGVAPAAQWIGCRNMDQGNGMPSTYSECFEFFIAPTDSTGANPDPSKAPDVFNNSWGCPASEGCAALTLQVPLENVRAAGIVPIVSAGNGGSAGCSTVSDPPSIYQAAISIGASGNNSNSIASFSSRGPVTADGSNRQKPNVTAPGVSIRSSYGSSDTAYQSLSGTSMSGPHTVGTVALIFSAHPELKGNVDMIQTMLEQSAVHLTSAQNCTVPGTMIPNNTFGWGRIDALAAVTFGQATPTPTPAGATPTPSGATPTPSGATPTPSGATPTPSGATPTPGGATPTPSGATPTPSGATPTPGGPTPTPGATPTATPSGPALAINLSTRLLVGTGNNVGIGGFIVSGTGPRTVLIRGIGPSLTALGIPGALSDPLLELHGTGGFQTITNNNWRETQESQIQATGIAPSNDLESAILATLDPGAYTAILKGNADVTGVGLVEIYDLSPGGPSKLGNISTRAFVNTGNDIVIAGFILGAGGGDDPIIVRGLGPSLSDLGLSPVLSDPMLELRNLDGAVVASNNDWQNGPPISLPPPNALESAIQMTLAPGSYTALLSGVSGATGLGLVEVYDNPSSNPTPTPGATPTPGGETPTPTPPVGPTPTPVPPTPTPGVTVCTENFDGVTAPVLPAGWVASNPTAGDGVLFVTTTTSSDSPPNNAFIADQDGISDKVLDRQVTINSASPVLTFRNNFDSEFSGGVFWDGGVLEISTPTISGGDFLDVTDSHVGGSITSGGYTGVISSDASNPLAGRMAWSGSSGGYIDTVINLGPNLNGQTITLRFRFGSDEAAAAPGWHIDTLSITGASCQ